MRMRIFGRNIKRMGRSAVLLLLVWIRDVVDTGMAFGNGRRAWHGMGMIWRTTWEKCG
jgi:hypothetical protein